ncbi:hypothetical protein ABT154_19760 [Streptomyces sp. NPDC001728]|uniref:hypothetical protein n=1 Tax=Streptomyces sp. NPDC001728 TaxID=3154396 RepID=UPI003333930E
MRISGPLVAVALGVALVGCGVRPTGVIGAGESASGPTRGVRLYYASDSGLRGVPVLDREIENLATVVKLLASGPPPAEQLDGLTNLVRIGGYRVTGHDTRVTVRLEEPYEETGRDLGTGQLVCTLARAQSVLDPKVGADDVEVTLRAPGDAVLGPYRCAEFLNR